MPFLSNPAQRLDWAVQQFKTMPANKQSGHPLLVRDAIQSVYGSHDSDAEIERLVSLIVALPDQAVEAQRRSAQTDTYFQRWYEPVHVAVSKLCNLDYGIAEFQNLLQPQHLESLGTAARLLGTVEAEDDAEELDVISMLDETLDQLGDDVLTMTRLVPEMRTFLLDHIDRMRLALREFRIRGGEGVANVSDAAVGAIFRSWSAFPATARTDEADSMFRRVVAVSAKVGEVVVSASTVATASAILMSAAEDLIQLMG